MACLISNSKIEWSSRRGMKELDLILQPFISEAFSLLSDEQKNHFVALLLLDDLTLFDALFNQKVLIDPHLNDLVDLLKSYRQQKYQQQGK